MQHGSLFRLLLGAEFESRLALQQSHVLPRFCLKPAIYHLGKLAYRV